MARVVFNLCGSTKCGRTINIAMFYHRENAQEASDDFNHNGKINQMIYYDYKRLKAKLDFMFIMPA